MPALLDHEQPLVARRGGHVDRRAQAVGDLDEPEGPARALALRAPAASAAWRAGGAAQSNSGQARRRIRVRTLRNLHGDPGVGSRLTSAADGAHACGRRRRARRPGARPGTTAGACCRALPPTCGTRPPRWACASATPLGPRDAARARSARCAATSPSARTRAWRSTCTCAPSGAGSGLGGSLLVQLLARARALGAEVSGLRARRRPRLGRARRAPLTCKIVECDRFLLLEVDHATMPRSAGPGVRALAARASRGRARGLAARAGPPRRARHERALRARDASRRGARACSRLRAAARRPCSSRAGADGARRRHLRAARLRRAARDGLPRVHGRGRAARGQGHGLALKLAAIALRARAGRAPAGRRHEPGNTAMLALNERLGYRRRARRPQPRRSPVSDFRIDLRVRFAETDAMGVAHHAAYLPYLETRPRRVPARARPPLPRAARPRRHRVRRRRHRPALPRAAALRRRVHGHVRARRARARDVQPGLPRRARRAADPQRPHAACGARSRDGRPAAPAGVAGGPPGRVA